MRHLHQPFEQANNMPAYITLEKMLCFYEERGMYFAMFEKILPTKKGKQMRDLLDEMPDPSVNWVK